MQNDSFTGLTFNLLFYLWISAFYSLYILVIIKITVQHDCAFTYFQFLIKIYLFVSTNICWIVSNFNVMNSAYFKIDPFLVTLDKYNRSQKSIIFPNYQFNEFAYKAFRVYWKQIHANQNYFLLPSQQQDFRK